MIFQFDLARLELYQRESLQESLDEIQSENVSEIVVLAVDLPNEFLVLTSDTFEYLCGLVYRENVCPTCLSPNRNRNLNRSSSRNRNRNRNRTWNRNRNRSMHSKTSSTRS